MSKHTVKRKNRILKTLFLLFLSLSLVTGAVAYAWFDSINVNLRRNAESIESARQALKPSSKNYGDPVNFLILGSDKRYEEKDDPGRSDTLIFMRVDYKKKRVYLVSIPRDSRVRIPGEGMDKINAAYAYGGPRLTIRTVEAFTGMEINHYIQIDFRGFKKMVDILGGVDVEVKETINSRTKGYTMYIPKGRQRMNGTLALNYVRYRHEDSDFERAERQQNFISALVKNALRWDSIWKIPRLVNILSQNIETDLSVRELTDLARFLRGMKQKDIETITVPGRSGMQNDVSYVFPDRAALNEIVDTMLQGESLKELKSQLESGKMLSEDISISVLNGSGVSGMALNAREMLADRGFNVTRVGTAPTSDYLNTEIQVGSQNYWIAKKVKKMALKEAEIKVVSKKKLPTDIVVIVGKDFIPKGSTR